MNIIYLNNFDSFIPISTGTYEAEIYLKGKKAYKIFNPGYTYAIYNEKELKNKQKKIELLHDMDLSKQFLLPIDQIFLDNSFRGFTSKYINGESLNHIKISFKKRRLQVLKQVLELIKEAHSKGLILNDINPGNIIYHKIPYLCDLDNCKIDGLNPNFINSMLPEFYKSDITNKDINEKTDFFLFNIIIFYLMSGLKVETLFNQELMQQELLKHNSEFREFYYDFINLQNTDPNDLLKTYEKKLQFRR